MSEKSDFQTLLQRHRENNVWCVCGHRPSQHGADGACSEYGQSAVGSDGAGCFCLAFAAVDWGGRV